MARGCRSVLQRLPWTCRTRRWFRAPRPAAQTAGTYANKHMTNGVGEPWGAHILKIKHNYRHLGKDVELDIVESLKLVRDVGLVLRGATAALREGGLHVRPADVRAPSELCQPRRTDHLGAFLLHAHEACCLAWMMDEAQ